jgi:hypothetical protein
VFWGADDVMYANGRGTFGIWPGTIVITATGSIFYGTQFSSTGPNGAYLPTPLNSISNSYPLDEAVGINTAAYPTKRNYIGALIGAFVPASVASQAGFQPVDGTKNLAPIGIVPSTLFFVGNRHSIDVSSAGTLYLGINDNNVDDNSGSFTATAVSP